MEVEIGEFASADSEPSSAKKLKQNEGDVTKDCKKTNQEGSTTGSLNLDNLNGSFSDLSCQEHNEAGETVDDVSDYEDNDDYMYDMNDDDDDGDGDGDGDGDDDDYLKMQAQFDNVDLPPGIEAPVSWLEHPASSANGPAAASSLSQNNVAGQQTGVGTSSLQIHEDVNNMTAGTSSSTVLTVSTSAEKDLEEKQDEVLRKFHLFKRFDVVDDFSDHHFNRAGLNDQQPPKTWVKRIQDEWKILEKDLPDTIYVRVYERRMDLLRAIIVGPAGTPYHDGLFVFDVLFPATYPDIPPMVYYYSGGLRLNPNLYDCGKVCLSLLNTWSGDTNEMWMPKTSTMLQVLVSIQALILNAKPFFNEPGYANMYTGIDGDRRSKAYNEDVFILSLKTMMYTLRRPPKYFEDFVAGHFRLRAHDILSACKAYMEGAEVGSAAKGRVQGTNNVRSNQHNEFMQALTRMMNNLITNFAKNGSKDCEQFRLPG